MLIAWNNQANRQRQINTGRQTDRHTDAVRRRQRYPVRQMEREQQRQRARVTSMKEGMMEEREDV